MHLLRAACIPLLLLCHAPVMAEAAVTPGKTGAAALDINSPDGLIRAVAQKLLDRIKADRKVLINNPDKLFAMVDEVVLPHFDFPLMARLVLGEQWTAANDKQQQRFLEGFKSLLVKTYGNALLQYSNETITFRPAQLGSKPGRASVASLIQSAGAAPVPMEYRMRKLDDQWLIYDVVVDGISLVTNYRGTYAAEIQRDGLESLIKKLEQQTTG